MVLLCHFSAAFCVNANEQQSQLLQLKPDILATRGQQKQACDMTLTYYHIVITHPMDTEKNQRQQSRVCVPLMNSLSF